MSVGKTEKAQHYTSAKNYTDLDGLSRSFDFIDHDVKASTSFYNGEDIEQVKKQMKDYRIELIDRILATPAATAPPEFYDFTLHGDRPTIDWNKVMLEDAGLMIDKLRTICVIMERRNNI